MVRGCSGPSAFAAVAARGSGFLGGGDAAASRADLAGEVLGADLLFAARALHFDGVMAASAFMAITRSTPGYFFASGFG